MDRRAKPKKGEAEAKRRPARKSPKDDSAKVRDFEKRLAEVLKREAEALEQQTATAEILRVISQSPTDVQPVFDTIVRSALRLLGGFSATLRQLAGDRLDLVAFSMTSEPGDEALRGLSQLLLAEDPMYAQVVHDRAPCFSIDTETDVRVGSRRRAVARVRGYRSLLIMPMLCRGSVIGAIAVTRREPGTFTDVESTLLGYRTVLAVPLLREGTAIGSIGLRTDADPFTDKQIALLRTFADQAVIAIENVRLFTELQEKNRALTQAHAQVSEALEQQTATSEILRVISQSPTEVQPVLDAIVKSATTLCDATVGHLLRFDGELLSLVAQHNSTPEMDEALRRFYPMRASRDQVSGGAILGRSVVQIADVFADPEYRPDVAVAVGWRSRIGVPLLRDGNPIGVIVINRTDPGSFEDTHVELLKTFADQAVIAIENVRLFKELEARTQDLTRSVGELQALGEVGRAVSSTLDLQTVLDTIVTRAVQLSGTGGGFIYEYDDTTTEFHLRATHQVEEELAEALRVEPIRLGEGATGRAAATRAPVQIADALDEREYTFTRIRSILARLGYRSVLAVPLLLEQRVLGSLVVQRREVGTFAPEVVNLLQTFATQSALAIQNARLFHEIEDKSRELEAASRHKSEFLANMSHELRTPLNAIIGFSEVLADRMFGELNEKQAEYLKDIHASGQHLLSLINDILDLSKIEAGRMELELTDFDVVTAIDNALTLVRERAGRRGIRLGGVLDESLGTIRADERKVKQVLLNLLSNAIKFTPEGGRIDVHAVPRDGTVEVSVADTGVGIAPEDQEAIFEEFRQVGTADKKVEGTGLGLALSRKFIELHGGRIWVKSELGTGSTFAFTLPIQRDGGLPLQ